MKRDSIDSRVSDTDLVGLRAALEFTGEISFSAMGYPLLDNPNRDYIAELRALINPGRMLEISTAMSGVVAAYSKAITLMSSPIGEVKASGMIIEAALRPIIQRLVKAYEHTPDEKKENKK